MLIPWGPLVDNRAFESQSWLAKTWALPPAGDNDAEVGSARKFFLFFLRHLHLDSSEEPDRFARAESSSRDHACFMCQDRVAVRCADFERAFGQVHVDVLAQMALEVFSLVRSLERAQVVRNSRQAQQITVRQVRILVYNDILLEDPAHGFLLDTP
jgi:hypothetical protein